MDTSTPEPASLTIGFVPGVTPSKWIRRWEDRHRDIKLSVFQCDESDQTRILREGRSDMAFVRLPVDQAGLSVIPLYAEVPVVVAPKDHEISLFDEVPVAELAAENLLQDAELVPEWRDVSDDIRNGQRNPAPDVNGMSALFELVAAGVGILIVPMSVARLHGRKDVVHRPVSGVAETEIGLAWVTERKTELMEEFIGIVRGRTERSSRQPLGQEGSQQEGSRKNSSKKSSGRPSRVPKPGSAKRGPKGLGSKRSPRRRGR